MAQSPEWHPERYRDLVLLWARQLHLDPRLQRRFDSSDLAHDTLLKAHKKIGEFRTPKGKKTYKRYSTAEFGVSAGLHTIAFRGTAVSDKSTSLLDLVELERVKPAK